MAIQILPARLANQIAAGEVVERPASVVKELVENSLDSGATRIDIDIEKGGEKLIRVRDNGKGIAKDELALALSRHATSKIHSLDDLEAIMSLGFRGEALASISSVSRLTLTSRPAAQEEAWSAYSEGRDMAVQVKPAAHPVGTTVEVLDLFFNTPARRKFLRTEKTEFTHIDDLLKRIALSRFDITLIVRHNGKIVRQYRAANSKVQMEKRLAAVCGASFVREVLHLELEHQGLKLHGWISTPQGARSQSDLQYCYVNGRMMRDKLINHAIRQSYENTLRPDQYAAYVLFIELDPHQVDVNVHPAKHEVRFHQARLVHDFIYQAIADALAQSHYIAEPEVNESAFYHAQDDEQTQSVPERVYQAIDNTPAYPNKVSDSAQAEFSHRQPGHSDSHTRQPWSAGSNAKSGQQKSQRSDSPAPVKAQMQAYKELLATPDDVADIAIPHHVESTPQPDCKAADSAPQSLGKAVSVVDGRFLLMADKSNSMLVSLARCEYYRQLGQLLPGDGALKSQPLLVPLALKLEAKSLQAAENNQALLAVLGIEFKRRSPQALVVMGVPSPLRQQNLQQLLTDLLSYAASYQEKETQLNVGILAKWLSKQVAVVKSHYTLSEAIQIISQLEQLWGQQLPLHDKTFVSPVDFSATIARLLS